MFPKIKDWILWACLGALAAGAFCLYRMPTKVEIFRTWGVFGFLEVPLLVVCGVLAGLFVALTLRVGGQIAKLLPVRGAVVLALAALLANAAIVGWIILRPASSGAAGAEGETGRLPDIVVVIYDTARADILADEEGRVPQWYPRLREFADGAVTYRNAVSTAPWTLPAHASLFTGLSQLDHGATEECPVLRPGIATIARLLQEQGYHTAAVVANPWLSKERGFDQGFEEYAELWHENVPLVFRASSQLGWNAWPSTADPRADKGARLASRISRRTIENADQNRPLFLFVNVVDAHPPFDRIPLPERHAFVPEDALRQGIDPDAVPQDWVEILAGKTQLSAVDTEMLWALDRGAVAYLDTHLGKILDALDRRGRTDTSFIAVSSDHGCALGDDRRLGSGFDLRDDMLRIPMVVRYPDGQGAGTLRDDLVYLYDLFPTMLEVAGITERYGMQDRGTTASKNALSLLSGPRRTYGLSGYARPVNLIRTLWESRPQFDSDYLDRRLLSLRGDRYKLVWTSTGKDQLFDLRGKGEKEDLADMLPAVLKEQQELLRTMLGMEPDLAWKRELELARKYLSDEQNIDSDSRTLDVLRSLGYVGGNP